MLVKTLLSAAIVFVCSSASYATIVIPGAAPDLNPDTFGVLPANAFGGSGIPTNAVAISTSTHGGNTITLGLSATPRFSSPTPSNDGAGAFTASVGESGPGLSLWNFSYHFNISGPGTVSNYRFELSYDLDAAASTPLSAHGVANLSLGLVTLGMPATKTFGDSQNAGFGYLATGVPPFWTAPVPAMTFDPNALGEYTFQLRVYDLLVGGSLIDQVSMSVSAVPEPTAALFGTLLASGLGMTIARRRREEEIA